MLKAKLKLICGELGSNDGFNNKENASENHEIREVVTGVEGGEIYKEYATVMLDLLSKVMYSMKVEEVSGIFSKLSGCGISCK